MLGYFFHFGKSQWRRAQGCGLHARYVGDGDFGLQLRMLYALVAVYDELMTTTFFKENAEELQELLDYFETTWIGSINRRGRTVTMVQIFQSKADMEVLMFGRKLLI